MPSLTVFPGRSHISFIPIIDKKGNTKCSVSNEYDMNKLFTEDDFFGFKHVARENNINMTTLFYKKISRGDFAKCSNDTIEGRALAASQILPKQYYFRSSYLEMHYATGKKIRCIGLFLLVFG